MTPAAAWAVYWKSHKDRGCLPDAPKATSDMLAGGWQAFARQLPPGASLLDMATGGGAVLRAIRQVRPDLALTGVDEAAVGGSPPGIALRSGVDCAHLPFEDRSIDAISSQFGIEYCPPAALAEAVRVARPGAPLRFIVHDRTGIAVRQNKARRDALRALLDAGLVPLARRVAAGLGEDAAMARAVAAARHAHRLQSIGEELPAALGAVLRSGNPREGIDRIAGQSEGELARLDAMVAAARDEAGAALLAEALGLAGAPSRASALHDPHGGQLAWLIEGRRAA